MSQHIMTEESNTPATPSETKWTQYFKSAGMFFKGSNGTEQQVATLVNGTIPSNQLSAVEWSIVTSKPTTVGGFGITDFFSQVFSGFSAVTGAITTSDTLTQVLNKLAGNITTKLDSSSFSDSGVTSKLLTGFSSGAGTVAATDTILQAINKLVGNAASYITESSSNILTNKTFQAYRETVVTPSIIAGTLTLDLSSGNVFNVTHNANITTLAFSNLPPNGVSCSFTVNLTQDATGGRTFAFPTSCKFSGGTVLTLSTTANNKNKLVFDTLNGGTTYDVALVGKDYA